MIEDALDARDIALDALLHAHRACSAQGVFAGLCALDAAQNNLDDALAIEAADRAVKARQKVLREKLSPSGRIVDRGCQPQYSGTNGVPHRAATKVERGETLEVTLDDLARTLTTFVKDQPPKHYTLQETLDNLDKDMAAMFERRRHE